MQNNDWESCLRHNHSTYRKCSKDYSRSTEMQVSEEKCIDFDNAVQEAANALGCSKDSAASCDALAWNANGSPVLIEFKNGRISDKTKSNIRGEMCNSVLFLESFLNKPWTDLRHKLNFVLVYNNVNNPLNSKQYIRDASYNLAAGTTGIRFGLEKAYNLYFQKIQTVTEEEFNKLVIEEKYHCEYYE